MADLSGVVKDLKGQPVASAFVVVFPGNSAQWHAFPRTLRIPIRPDSDGHFHVTGLAAGDYYLAIMNDFDPDVWSSAEKMSELKNAGVKIELAEGEHGVEDIVLAPR